MHEGKKWEKTASKKKSIIGVTSDRSMGLLGEYVCREAKQSREPERPKVYVTLKLKLEIWVGMNQKAWKVGSRDGEPRKTAF